MKTLILFFLILVLSVCGYSQTEWTVVQKDFPANFTAVCFPTVSYGVIVWEGGFVFISNDGGNNWENHTDEDIPIMLSLYFKDAQNGFATGYDRIYRTHNGGKNWLGMPTMTPNFAFDDVFFINEQTGWAIGNWSIVAKTIDGGYIWEDVWKGVNLDLHSVHFFDVNNGIAVGDEDFIFKTSDGGNEWIHTETGVMNNWWSVKFVNRNTGFIAGDTGKILKTNDGGNTWTELYTGTSERLRSMSFVNKNDGWAVGNNGTIIATTNGGQDWFPEYSGVEYDLNCVFFKDKIHGWIVGRDGTILKTKVSGPINK